ncbi:hypothetical protein SAMN05444161_3117 [Rhizobiales bacterium GAS191]|nr:hypothetical protein SAMN05444161_3117 [Rhizobiales bacterium GAS191]
MYLTRVSNSHIEKRFLDGGNSVKSKSLTAVNAALLFLNLLLLAKSSKHMSLPDNIPQGWATLIAGVIGLGAIAWQTNRGFANLISSQDYRAKIERDAREHQADIARKAKDEDIDHQRRTLAAALHGELLAVRSSIRNRADMLRIQTSLGATLPEDRLREGLRDFGVPGAKSPVFQSQLENIGLLGPSIANDVVQVYARAGIGLERGSMRTLSVTAIQNLLQTVIAAIDRCVPQIDHVAMRLASLQADGVSDPGPLPLA